jgi:hypothetical protein
MELNCYSLHMPSWREEGKLRIFLHTSIFVTVWHVTFSVEVSQAGKTEYSGRHIKLCSVSTAHWRRQPVNVC